jgi:hypothetical protein
MSEYDIEFEDFEIFEENDDDDYDGPDAYVDEAQEDNTVFPLLPDPEDLQDSIRELARVAENSPMLRQIFLCEFTPYRVCAAHVPLTRSVISTLASRPDRHWW